MGSWLAEWPDVWVYRCMYICMDGCTVRWIDGWEDGPGLVWMDGWIDLLIAV